MEGVVEGPPSGPWLAYQLQYLICTGALAGADTKLVDQYFVANFPGVPTNVKECKNIAHR